MDILEFLKELKETVESKTTWNTIKEFDDIFTKENRPRLFIAVEGEFEGKPFYLSIQASRHHYCRPRSTEDDLTKYETIELAVIYEDEFVNIKGFVDDSLADEVNEYYNGSVYGHLPVELIEKLYQALFKAVQGI